MLLKGVTDTKTNDYIMKTKAQSDKSLKLVTLKKPLPKGHSVNKLKQIL
jgi:hypothetical protein